MHIMLSLIMRGTEARSTLRGGYITCIGGKYNAQKSSGVHCSWGGHMTYIGEKYNAQKSSMGKYEGKRMLVRPSSSSWKDYIKRNVKK